MTYRKNFTNRRTAQLILATMMITTTTFAERVTTDFDRNTDFAQYKTYAWAPGGIPAKDSLWNQRIIENIEHQLAARGLQRVDTGADLYVTYSGVLKETASLEGFGTGGRWMGGSFSIDRVTKQEGTLVVEVSDAKSARLVWRGMATETVSDKTNKNISKLEKIVEKMFREFPLERAK